MSNVISKDNLQATGQRSKNFTNAKILELTEAIQQDLGDIITFFTASGLYIDNDGDMAQLEPENEEEETES